MNPSSGPVESREERNLWIGRVVILAILSATVSLLVAELCKSYLVHREMRRAERTMVDMRTIASSAEAYAAENGGYPAPPGSIAEGRRKSQYSSTLPPAAWPIAKKQRASELERLLSGRYGNLPDEDGWGHPFLYATTADRRSYVVVSTGRDGELELPDLFVRGPVRDTRRDLVYADGGFHVWLEQT